MHYSEKLFPGTASGSPPVIAQGKANYTPREGKEEIVRHLRGYRPFVDHVLTSDVDVWRLSRDPIAVLNFIRWDRSLARDPDLGGSAAIFLGNVLIAVGSPGAQWRVYGDRFPSLFGAAPSEVRDVVSFVSSTNEETYRTFMQKVEEWIRDGTVPRPSATC